MIFAIFIIPTQLIGQYTVKYDFHPYDPDSDIVSFIDTVKTEVIRSFTLVEYSPYWNLPYPEIKPSGRKNKTFNLINSKTLQEDIPGLITYKESEYITPVEGYTFSQVQIVPDNNYIIVYHYMMVLSTERLYGYATVLHIYNLKGEIHREVISSDVEIEEAYITNDGKYLIYRFGVGLTEADSEKSNTGYRIVSLETLDIIVHEKVDARDAIGMAAWDDIITVSYRYNNDPSKYLAIAFLPENNTRYSIILSENILYKRKEVTSDGFVIQKNGEADNNYVIRFDKDFNASKIR
jgi:hypothetical protein